VSKLLLLASRSSILRDHFQKMIIVLLEHTVE